MHAICSIPELSINQCYTADDDFEQTVLIDGEHGAIHHDTKLPMVQFIINVSRATFILGVRAGTLTNRAELPRLSFKVCK